MAPVSAVLSRLGRGGYSPAPVTGRAAGNSHVTSDARGQAAAQPGKGAGDGVANTSPYPARDIITPPEQLNRRAYGGPAYQWGRLIARDRAITAYRGHTQSSSTEQRTGGTPNPEADGPPRPSYRMSNRTLSWQIGTDDTRGLDNGQFHAAVPAGSKQFPLGTQGDAWSTVYGGTRGLANYRPYGARRGYRGGPQPRVVAQPGGPYRAGTLLQAGAPQDGPQKVYGGVPWGLTTHVVEPMKVSAATIRARFPQIRTPSINRPLNSKAAGQSYDQQVVHLDGHQAVKVPRIQPGRQPGVNRRFR